MSCHIIYHLDLLWRPPSRQIGHDFKIKLTAKAYSTFAKYRHCTDTGSEHFRNFVLRETEKSQTEQIQWLMKVSK